MRGPDYRRLAQRIPAARRLSSQDDGASALRTRPRRPGSPLRRRSGCWRCSQSSRSRAARGFGHHSQATPTPGYVSYAVTVFLILFVLMIPVAVYCVPAPGSRETARRRFAGACKSRILSSSRGRCLVLRADRVRRQSTQAPSRPALQHSTCRARALRTRASRAPRARRCSHVPAHVPVDRALGRRRPARRRRRRFVVR